MNQLMQFHIISLSHRYGNLALKFSSHNHRRVRNGKVCKEDSYISLDHPMETKGKRDNTFALTSQGFLEVGEKRQAIN